MQLVVLLYVLVKALMWLMETIMLMLKTVRDVSVTMEMPLSVSLPSALLFNKLLLCVLTKEAATVMGKLLK